VAKKCMLCGEELPHQDRCPEIIRRSRGQGIVPRVNRMAFLDANPPANFRSLLGEDLFESMKIMDSAYPVREVSTDDGETSVTGSNADGVKGFVYTRTISGDTQEIEGEKYLVVEEKKRLEIRMKSESKGILEWLRRGK
jgi:hypothetical protein